MIGLGSVKSSKLFNKVTVEAGDDGWWWLVSWAGSSSAHLTQKGRRVPPLPPSALSRSLSPSLLLQGRLTGSWGRTGIERWGGASRPVQWKNQTLFGAPVFGSFGIDNRSNWLTFFPRGNSGDIKDCRKRETTSKFPLWLLKQFNLSLKWIIRVVVFRNAKDYDICKLAIFVVVVFFGLWILGALDTEKLVTKTMSQNYFL